MGNILNRVRISTWRYCKYCGRGFHADEEGMSYDNVCPMCVTARHVNYPDQPANVNSMSVGKSHTDNP